MLVQSLEGLLLLVLLVRAWPRWRHLPTIMRASPYVTFCVVYAASFIWAFSGFGNFGILARQRVLMLPFFLVLLALPAIAPRRRRSRDAKVLLDARR
jgi:apolipoprotein N-acyltransferase